MFISFDGIDGCGKSTQIARVANILTQNGFKVKVTKDPGDNKISEQIRNILLNPENQELCDISEFFLFLAARRQNYETVIKPHLDQKFIVLTDRYMLSTYVYQYLCKRFDELPYKYIESMIMLSGGQYSTLAFILDVSFDTFKARLNAKKLDRIEQYGDDYFKQVIDSFSTIHNKYHKHHDDIYYYSNRIAHINANQNIEDVTTEIITSLKQFEMFKNLQNLHIPTLDIRVESLKIDANPRKYIVEMGDENV